MSAPRRVSVLGVHVDCVDMGRTPAAVDDMVAGGLLRTILAVNPEKVTKAQHDPVLSRIEFCKPALRCLYTAVSKACL